MRRIFSGAPRVRVCRRGHIRDGVDGGGAAVALAVVEAVGQRVVVRGETAASIGDPEQGVQGTTGGGRGQDGLHSLVYQHGVAAQHREGDRQRAARPRLNVDGLHRRKRRRRRERWCRTCCVD